MTLLMAEVKAVIEEAMQHEKLQAYAQQLAQSGTKLHETTMKLVELAMKERAEVFLADATLYLEYFGLNVLAWQWLKQGLAIIKGLEENTEGPEYEFYMGKWQTLRYYFEYELVKGISLRKRLLSENRVTLETEPVHLN